MRAWFIVLVVIVAVLGLIALAAWHDHYISACMGSGNTREWCSAQWWQTL